MTAADADDAGQLARHQAAARAEQGEALAAALDLIEREACSARGLELRALVARLGRAYARAAARLTHAEQAAARHAMRHERAVAEGEGA